KATLHFVDALLRRPVARVDADDFLEIGERLLVVAVHVRLESLREDLVLRGLDVHETGGRKKRQDPEEDGAKDSVQTEQAAVTAHRLSSRTCAVLRFSRSPSGLPHSSGRAPGTSST